MIPPETIEQIRQATDIVQVIGEYVRLKKKGRAFWANCPFHTEKTPSFQVNPDRQIYHCFGCGKGGNVITFLIEHEKMSFIETVQLLARKANITIRESATDFKREEIERLNFAQQVAMEYFCKQLHLSKYRVVLDSYLKTKRAISDESIEFFKLGLSGEEWDGLLKYAATKDLKPDDLVKAGLAILSDNTKQHFDRFRQRLMIPIFNLTSRPIAFGGRTLKKGEQAKYINSPETPLYSKGSVLYGLNFARDHIREKNAVIVVEGYFDFISVWQAGVRNVVASSGTAFTAQQARLLARFAEDVYLFFDADSAGQNAALRSVDALFDAGLEVKVVMAPTGHDPDTVARTWGHDKILELLHDAVRYIPFRVRDVAIEKTGIIVKEKLVKELGGLANRISDPTRRSLFLQEAAAVLGVNADLFHMTGRHQTPTATQTAPRSSAGKFEREFLSVLFNNPGSIDDIISKVSPDDFESAQLKRLYAAMIVQYRESGLIDARALVDRFSDAESISAITELAAQSLDDDKIDAEAVAQTKNFIERKQERIRARLVEQLAQAEAAGDHDKATSLLQEMKRYGL
ncbi:MAG: DNA primase [candidate division Zixibacteria bacterium]|nr:DNA primase [candidate division Zixibacteria bacterium]